MVAGTAAPYTHEYFQPNHQGSIIAMTSDAGDRVEGPFKYDPYGNCFAGSNPCSAGEPYRFTGRRFDAETGLYYYRARYYDPQKGRFLQTDPVGYSADVNLYTYVGNDPVDRTDPTGRASCDAPGMTSCPDIPRASPQVEQAAATAAQPQSVAAGRSEQGSVVLTSKSDNSVTRTLTGSDAGKSNPNDPQHGFNFDYKKNSNENTGATEHSHPGSDASLPEVRRATDTRNAYPSKTDLQKTMNVTRAPVIVKGPNGTISETYRVGGVDHYVVLSGPGPSISVPSDISHDFVVDPNP
jgi:RHS repeat-associated protein